MYKEKKILALITAREGSKGIPKKNIKNLGGYPLIAWTITAAKKSKYLDSLIISTDDDQIAETARSFGCEVPFIRPKELALDETPSMDVIMHALSYFHEKFDYLLLLQPTSPFRKSSDIDQIIRQTIDNNQTMTVSVVRQKKPPHFSLIIDEDATLKQIIPTEKQLRRQDFPLTYEHNGSLYFSEINYLYKTKSYLKSAPYVMSGPLSSLDIDTFDDWLFAEFLIKSYGITLEENNI
jgi:CMP-N,N'-diacetyllegionaminic acid synthase